MAILEHELRSAANSAVTPLRRHLPSRDEYYGMVKAGVFGDRRLELIEGEIVEMAPIGPAHASINYPLARLLENAFGEGFALRIDAPISLGEDDRPSEPQPDITVVNGVAQDYRTHHPHPSEIALVVEISDSTLTEDRTIKAALYSSAGIPEYWIVNLVDNRVEVLRSPGESGYSSVSTHEIGDAIEPLFGPGQFIAVATVFLQNS